MDEPLPGLLTVTPAKDQAIVNTTKLRAKTILRILKTPTPEFVLTFKRKATVSG